MVTLARGLALAGLQVARGLGGTAAHADETHRPTGLSAAVADAPTPAPSATPTDPDAGWPALAPGEEAIPPAQGARIIYGVWDTTWGRMLITLYADRSFLAAYEYGDGAIVGTLQGEYLVGWWCEESTREPPADAGEVQFRMVRTGGAQPEYRLQGRWSYGMRPGDSTWRTWDGTPTAESADAELRLRQRNATSLCAAPFAASGAVAQAPLTIDTPSTLSSLRTVQSVTVVAAAAAGGGAVVLIAVAAYPAVLLDGTLTANRDRLFGWARAPAARVKRWGAASRNRIPSWAGVTLGLIATIVLSGFIEPRFGFNLGSLRLLLSLAISLFFERLLFLLIVRRLVRRRAPGLQPTLSFAASSLLFVAVAVLLTRITGFEPGIVFGLVLGLALASDLSKLGDARLALGAGAWALVLGLVGWLGYSAMVALFGHDPNAFVLFLQETLSGFAVSGIAALPIAMLPLAVLDGGAVWAWRKFVWLVAYLVGLAAFLIVVLPMPTSWDQVSTTYVVWIVLYGAFCVLAIGVWALFRYVPRRRKAADGLASAGAVEQAEPTASVRPAPPPESTVTDSA
jgi:hypothetical protein